MILEEIRLTNFRCFYGKASIQFSDDPERNVTIIYAENGVGKTTLLNALLWCFYGRTTSRFEKSEDILNYDAKREGETEAHVEVRFEHEGKHYIARRSANAGNSSRDGEFKIVRVEDGSQKSLDAPDIFINTVIPKTMAQHFLFDGEHAEAFLGENNQKLVKKAVRDILGCSLIETAIKDLQAVSGRFRKKISTTGGSEEVQKLAEQCENIENQIKFDKNTIEELEKEHMQTTTQIKDIDQKLRNTEGAKDRQKRRDELITDLKHAQKHEKECQDAVYNWLGENGRSIVSKRITEKTFSYLDKKEHQGRIPSPYNEEFVNDTLKAQKCICGRELKRGSAEYKEVESLLEQAANKVMRDRIIRIRARLNNLKEGRAKAPNSLKKVQKEHADAKDRVSKIEAELNEISEKLKGIDLSDIAQREQRRVDLTKDLDNVNRKIGALQQKIEVKERELSDINAKIKKISAQYKQTTIYQQRYDMCDHIKNAMEVHLVEEEQVARKVLCASINKILMETTHKALKLRMTDAYVISLIDQEGTELPKSSGENQLLGLAFTASLIKFAKIRQNAKDHRLLAGTIAPLVLDSPFGQLDEHYRATTAKFIPKMARQVILLVSKSQASEEVLAALKDHLRFEYLLVRHNKEARGARTQESRNLHGKKYNTAIFDAEFDGTEVMEIAGL